MNAATEPMHVRVVSWSMTHGALAFVDDVRVRIRPRVDRPPKWLCDEHFDASGRTACVHIAALAATTPTTPANRRGDDRTTKGNTP